MRYNVIGVYYVMTEHALCVFRVILCVHDTRANFHLGGKYNARARTASYIRRSFRRVYPY